MIVDIAIAKPLLRLVLQGDALTRRALWMGLFEEAISVSLGVASPFLLKLTIDHLGRISALQLGFLIPGLVLSWIAPALLASLKLGHTAALVGFLHREIADQLLRGELPLLARGAGSGTGHTEGVLERLPLSLQLVIDSLVWRAAPLAAQTLVGLVALALTLPASYVVVLVSTMLIYLRVADHGAGRLAARVDGANAATTQASLALNDLLQNAQRVICNGALARELARLGAFAQARSHAQQAAAQAASTAARLQAVVLTGGLSLLLGAAASGAASHTISVGDFVLLQAFAVRLILPLSGLVTALRHSAVPLANIKEALRQSHAPQPAPPEATATRLGAPALELQQVSFGYPERGGGVRDLNLSIDRAQLVAIVGANGSGKSTLARLIGGLMAPDWGLILIEGRNLQSAPPEDRSQTVLYVPQFITLFNRSVRDNGLYPPARPDAAGLSARLARWNFNADDTPVDLNAFVGEKGGGLSGGQVQKLELARLCAIDAPILVLDESTSALDAGSEGQVLRALRRQSPGRLLMLITHRQTLAEQADQVVFLQAGRLAGLGPHATLMRDPGYRGLWS